MRALLTILFALFVVLIWAIYAANLWPWNGTEANYAAAFFSILFMAILIVIAFRIDAASRRP